MRFATKLLSAILLVCFVSASAWAQCVPYTHEIEGPFFFGWNVTSVVTTLDGQPITLHPVMGASVPPIDRGWATRGSPMDRGWSTHGFETSVLAADPDELDTFEQVTPYVATVETTDPPYTGDRRSIPPYAVVRYTFEYKGEGKMTSGTGAFEGAKGHVVTRGPFWLDLVYMPEPWTALGVPVPMEKGVWPAQLVAALQDPYDPLITPGNYGGYYTFTSRGQFCGVDLAALDLQ